MAVRGTTRPTRLLFVQTQAEMAGAQEISRILGEALARPGPAGEPAYDVHHLFLYRKSAGCDDFPNAHFAARERPGNPLAKAAFFARLALMMRAIGADVVLPFQHYGNIVAGPLARLIGTRRIIANHVSAPATISGTVRRLDRLLGLAGAYDVMTVNSQSTWRDYMAYPERYRRRIVHVPHGFARKTTTLDKAAARHALNLPETAALLGTVARLHPLKRIDLAMKLLPGNPDLHLAIAGQGPDADRLQAVAATLAIRDRVHFLGERRPDEIGLLLASLDVFVFPSEAETFGLAAVEAADAGIPVVSHDMPVMREVLQVEGAPCALFVDAADTEAFAARVRRLLIDRAEYDQLSALGRQLGAAHSLEAMVASYRALIEGTAPAGRPLPQPARTGKAA